MTDVKQDASGADDQGGTKGTEFVPPKDGSWVPRERLNEAERRHQAENMELRERLARLEGQVDRKPTEAKKVLTAAELQAAVDKGEITTVEASAILANQASEKTVTAVVTELDARKRMDGANAVLGRYIAAKPELRDKSSDAFQRVKAEFDSLVEAGADAKSIATELAATKAVFGPIDVLEKAGGKHERETHAETGGGNGNDRNDRNDGGSVWKDIPRKNRDYYEQAIAKGLYSGPDDPNLKKELGILRAKKKAA